MNKKSCELGLKNTNFTTPHGLDEENHYTTAYELAIIADYALNIDIIQEVVKTRTYTVHINNKAKNINNTNELLGFLDGVNGVKTGFTNKAGRCLVTSVNRNGFNIITVVLGADTKKYRTKDSIGLIEYTYSNYELIDLNELIQNEYAKWYNINKNRIEISKAKEPFIKFLLQENTVTKYPIKKEEKEKIEIQIQNKTLNFEAPIYKNVIVAELKVLENKNEIYSFGIHFANEIQRKTWKDYFKECLYSTR